jgi:hypothetical protein
MDPHPNLSNIFKYVLTGLPLTGAAASVFLPLSQAVHQLMILAVLVWVQVFFILNVFKSEGQSHG